VTADELDELEDEAELDEEAELEAAEEEDDVPKKLQALSVMDNMASIMVDKRRLFISIFFSFRDERWNK